MKTRIEAMVACLLMTCISISTAISSDEVKNMLQNPSFEEGLEQWRLELRRGAKAEMTIDENESVHGKQSIFIEIDKLDDNASESCIMLRQMDIFLEEDEEYTYCVWIKSEVVRPVALVIDKRTDPWTRYIRKVFDITAEGWKEYWGTFTMQESTPVRVDVRMGKSMGDLWIDDLRLYKGKYVEEPKEEESVANLLAKLTTTWGQIKNASPD